ncbi:MAG: hypothetical protein NWF01_03805 [Candidatus Bathyarchaeota archaeon]|nr:hypothetical protein [Candidatus Bathyarchaeota archaeon]
MTIVYQYTTIAGTTLTESFDYGSYYPTWNPNHAVSPGEHHFQYYEIPQYIIKASSTMKWTSAGCLIFDIAPQVQITEIYGYS